MAIEKMALVQIEGSLRKINKTLMNCCESKCFHIISANHENAQDDKSSQIKQLKMKNPYTALVSRCSALADGMEIQTKPVDYEDVEMNVSVDFANYISKLEAKYSLIADKISEVTDKLKSHSSALMQVEQVTGFNVDFKELYNCKYIKKRFGRLPVDSVSKLDYYNDMDFIVYRFNSDKDYVWLLYLVPNAYAVEVDEVFNSLYFERVMMPDYFCGDADEAKSLVLRLIREESEKMDTLRKQLDELKSQEENYFVKVYTKLNALAQSYELRQNVMVIHKKFYISGYVPKRKMADFRKEVESEEGVEVKEKPLDTASGSTPPVMLRNNWIVKPFEMFIKMYGLPNYKGFDPTPYVAATYMLIFGIMFGDLGQGILITLFGVLLDKLKHAKLAPIMERIGVTSAIFGVLYGSVFGNEEIITPFFKQPNFYEAMGMASAPKDIFQVSTILLIAAIAMGSVLIIISMMMNIVTCLRNRDFGNAIIGPNGISGLVFYVSLIAGAALQLGLGIEMFTTPYILGLILLPLVILFFKEPLIHLFKKLFTGRRTNSNSSLVHAVKTYSEAVSELGAVSSAGCDIEELMNNEYIKAKYGVFPVTSYNKLCDIKNATFAFYPFEINGENIGGVYLTSNTDAAACEKVFDELGFKTMKMPEHIRDLRKETKLHINEYLGTPNTEKKKSVGTFIIEGVIELFESCLTYLTNTMSFLRIGGFILSHAGMMLVVSVLAAKAGDSAIVVQIIGNLFVIGMEGFLVGIQVLRLEFYEIFSRFYKGDGKPFNPVVADFKIER